MHSNWGFVAWSNSDWRKSGAAYPKITFLKLSSVLHFDLIYLLFLMLILVLKFVLMLILVLKFF